MVDSPGTEGLRNGHGCTCVPVNEGLLDITFQPDQGFIQGPWRLEEFRGQRLCLSLATGQMGLLVRDGSLMSVFLDGAHHLEIGRGTGQVTPECHLLMLNPRANIDLRWNKDQPVNIANAAHLSVIGHCQVNIVRPARFFLNFLTDLESLDVESVTWRMDQTVRSILVDLLGNTHGYGEPHEAELQSRLTRLLPTDLAEDLEAVGLECLHLATYTTAPPVESIPAETSGQLSSFGHN